MDSLQYDNLQTQIDGKTYGLMVNWQTYEHKDKQTEKGQLIVSTIKHVRPNVQLDRHNDRQTDIDTNGKKTYRQTYEHKDNMADR